MQNSTSISANNSLASKFRRRGCNGSSGWVYVGLGNEMRAAGTADRYII